MTTLTAETQVSRTPTMREVAALAGVSIKTVSRVINQEPGVSPERSAKVREAIGMLHYQHNTTASSLRRSDQRTATIGLLLDDVANPFSSALHRAIEDIARQHETLVLAASSHEDAQREDEVVLALASRRVDGLIVVPVGPDRSSLLHVQRLGRPIVFVDRPAMGLEGDSVTVDNRAGAGVAIRHLAAHGHRQIAFLGDWHVIWTAAERYFGYVSALAAEGLRLESRLVQQDLQSIEAAERATSAMLLADNPPTALFTGQNLVTIGAIRALQRLGAADRVALVGFDDFLLADLLQPRVSVIAQDPAALGRAAADLLFTRLDGKQAAAQHIVLPTQIIPRGSGEIRA